MDDIKQVESKESKVTNGNNAGNQQSKKAT